ncbi:hypothetical protein M0Q50_07450 [bacterium]|jgi:hypothetical protein|nr:hypothetical protein [bacterium]
MLIQIKKTEREIYWYHNHIGEYYDVEICASIIDDEKVYRINNINDMFYGYNVKISDTINISEIRLKKLNSL